jgi:hypothetical protein
MTNHLIDVEEAEAECIRFAHALFLELNRPETSPEKLRSAPVNDARYSKKMCRRKNLGGMWGQFGFGGAYDFMFMEDSQDADCIAPSKDAFAAQMQCLNHWGQVLYALVPTVEDVLEECRDEVRTATQNHAAESRQTGQPMRRTNWLPDIPMLIAQLDEELGLYG